jgi:hypothetical protein
MLVGLDSVFGHDREELAYTLGLAEQRVRDYLGGRYLIPAPDANKIAALAAKHGVQVANPGRMKRKHNRDHRWRDLPEEEEISMEDAKKLPGYKKALKAFKRFHKTDPKSVRVIRVPDGKSGTTLAGNAVHVFLGHREQTPYTVPFGSKKDVRWYHDHPKDSQPSMLLNPQTGLVTDAGGSGMVDDWFYS